MARSTTNKAKGAAKKSARPASPKASINAKAQLTAISTAAHAIKTGNYDTKPGTAMVITLKIPMGAPATVVSWEDFKRSRDSRWQRQDWIERELKKLKPAKVAASKVTKSTAGGATETVSEKELSPKFDEAAAKKKLAAQYDAETKAKYEAECVKANNANAKFMQRSVAFAMFAALRGQEVQVSLTPVQQGFSAMFGSNGQQAQLGSGQPDEQPDFEAAADAADDDDDFDDGDDE